MHEAYIVAAARTAGGRRGGMLRDWHPADLAGRVLDALVENAAQYTRDGTITIAATAVELGDDRQFAIRVTDTGRGIDPAVLPTLFETFTATRDAVRPVA